MDVSIHGLTVPAVVPLCLIASRPLLPSKGCNGWLCLGCNGWLCLLAMQYWVSSDVLFEIARSGFLRSLQWIPYPVKAQGRGMSARRVMVNDACKPHRLSTLTP